MKTFCYNNKMEKNKFIYKNYIIIKTKKNQKY